MVLRFKTIFGEKSSIESDLNTTNIMNIISYYH